MLCSSGATHVLRVQEEVGGGGGAEAGERLAVGAVVQQAARAREHAEGERARAGRRARARAAAAGRHAVLRAHAAAPRLAHALQRYYLWIQLSFYNVKPKPMLTYLPKIDHVFFTLV